MFFYSTLNFRLSTLLPKTGRFKLLANIQKMEIACLI